LQINKGNEHGQIFFLERAEYGKQVIEQLSAKLTHKYERGFSSTNLRYFRTFYTVYSDRIPEIRHIACGEFKASGKRHTQSGVLDAMALAVEQAIQLRAVRRRQTHGHQSLGSHHYW
jgi:hypothetical protein